MGWSAEQDARDKPKPRHPRRRSLSFDNGTVIRFSVLFMRSTDLIDFAEASRFLEATIARTEIRATGHAILREVGHYLTDGTPPRALTQIAIRMPPRLCAVSLDGQNGSGKTYLAKRLQAAIAARQLNAFIPDIPTDPITASLIKASRQIGQSAFYLYDPYIDPLVWGLRLLRKIDMVYADPKAQIVIFDRYKLSTLMLQEFFLEVPPELIALPATYHPVVETHETRTVYREWLRTLLDILPDPHLAFHLHCSTETQAERLRQRRRPDSLVPASMMALQAFGHFALAWCANRQSRVTPIDTTANTEPETPVLQEIMALLQP